MDRSYFERYCMSGSYDDNYLDHSGIEHSIEICDHFGLPIKSVLVLGAATGRVLKHFEDSWGVRPYGCEISRWAHGRIPSRYRRRIACADMRRYVPELVRKGRNFDLIFSNSLVYLEAGEIPAFLALCSRLCGHFHFYSSTSEDCEPDDPYRVTLRPRAWWRNAFMSNGFAPTRSRYLWRATRKPGSRLPGSRGERRRVAEEGPPHGLQAARHGAAALA